MAVDLDLGKMIGPLPLGAWIGAVGGGLALLMYNRSHASAAPPVATSPDDAPESLNGEPGVGTGGWTYMPPQAPTGTDTGSVETEPDTNEAWGRRAVNGLIALGYPPAVSDAAIRKYLEGARLGAQEYTLVTIALGKYGAPPMILPAPMFGPPTLPKVTVGTAGKPVAVARKPPVSKPHVRHYIVRPGDTLSKIGKKYRVSWQSIYNANRKGKRRADGTPGMIVNANRISIGWKLVIPNS